jgi:hypothetical protein
MYNFLLQRAYHFNDSQTVKKAGRLGRIKHHPVVPLSTVPSFSRWGIGFITPD